MWLFKRKDNLNDEELAKRYFHTGDKRLVGDLFEKHVKTVYGVCLFYLRDKEAASDMVMQIFEKLIAELRRSEVKNFRAWLGFVVRNACISELRKAKGRHRLPERYLEFEVAEPNQNEEESIAEVSEELMLESMHSCLGQLKESQRRCIELFYLQNYSYQEISSRTGFLINEVKSYIQNGKRNLKLLIQEKIKSASHAAQ